MSVIVGVAWTEEMDAVLFLLKSIENTELPRGRVNVKSPEESVLWVFSPHRSLVCP